MWACLVHRSQSETIFRMPRALSALYFLSNENSFIVLTDWRVKQSVWFTGLEFRLRSSFFSYLGKMAWHQLATAEMHQLSWGLFVFLLCQVKNPGTDLIQAVSPTDLQLPGMGRYG